MKNPIKALSAESVRLTRSSRTARPSSLHPVRGPRIAVTLGLLAACGVASAQNDQAQVLGAQPAPAPTAGYNNPILDLTGLSTPGLGAGALIVPELPAGPGYLDLDASLLYTDNALLTSTDRIGTAIGLLGLDANYVRLGSELTIDALGTVNWVDYFNHSFPSSVYGNFNATAIWGHPTEFFQWMLRDTYTEGTVDPLAAPTPNALQEVNVVTTGPYFNLNFGSAERLTAYGLYSNTTFQSSPFGSQNYSGGAIFVHALSAASNLTLQADDTRTDFTQPGQGLASSGYDMRTAQLIYTGALSRTEISAAAGYATQNYAGPTTGSPEFSLAITHRVTPSASVYLRGQDGYTTFGNETRLNLDAPTTLPGFFGEQAATATPAPFKDQLISAGWTFGRARTTFSLVGAYERQLFVHDATFNSELKTFAAFITRRLRPTVDLRLAGYRTHGNYTKVGGNLTTTIGELSVTKRFRRLGVTFYYVRTHQVSRANDAELPFGFGIGNYDEDRVGLTLGYDLIGHHLPAAP